MTAAGLLALGASALAQAAEVHLRDDSVLTVGTPSIRGRLPVLFVHGHQFDNDPNPDPNYKKNWQDSSRPSFKQTVELPANSSLNIEDYYIHLDDQTRSITDDAVSIADAVDLILHRHDPQYAYPHNPAQTTRVQVVIIAYSKGTISARQYLKTQHAAQPDFHPVSELIAISPPNHGINTAAFAATDKLPVKQLYNGFHPDVSSIRAAVLGIDPSECTDSFDEPLATGYIATLNGHPIADSTSISVSFASEAPGSRHDGTATKTGTLYVNLFADGNRDFVGGLTPSSDCSPPDGRKLARNLSDDAVNLEVSEISGGDFGLPTTVHGNTVHTFEVICQALYGAMHHRSPEGQTCTDSAGLPTVPPPRAAAMLTLDFSGSMAALACPGCATRASVLKDAVTLFVELWAAVSVPTDLIGINYFSSNVTPSAINGGAPQPISLGTTSIITELNAQSPGGSTAMGGGLQQAIQQLSDPSVNAELRRVILFTDGMQNVNVMARVETDQLTFANESGHPATSPPGTPTVLASSPHIAVDTIGVGAGEAFVDLLDNIATATGGRAALTTEINEDLRLFFVNELINALKGFSPQLIAYRRGSIGTTGNSIQNFAIEGGPHRVVLKLSWKRGDKMDFAVRKDGVDVTASGRFISGEFYKIFVIDVPKKGKSPIAALGNWQMQIKGKKATPYETAAIVDGGKITYDAVFSAKKPKVGEPLDLVIRSTAGGKALDASAKVSATLMIPTTAPRDILTANPRKEPPAFEPGMTLAERQLLALSQNPKEWAKLRTKRQTVVLKRSRNGTFTTQLRPQVPGIYTAVVTLDGEAARIGKFSRTMTATTVVRTPESANPPK